MRAQTILHNGVHFPGVDLQHAVVPALVVAHAALGGGLGQLAVLRRPVLLQQVPGGGAKVAGGAGVVRSLASHFPRGIIFCLELLLR